MKNAVFSFVLAALLLMTTAYAAVTSSPDSINFYAYGEGLASAQNVVLSNSDLHNNLTVTYSGELTFRADSSEKINLTSGEIKIPANKSVTITADVGSSMSEIQSGAYTGFFYVKDKTTGDDAMPPIPVTVIVPGLKLTLSSNPSSKVQRGQTVNVTLTYKNIGKYSYLSDVTLDEFSVLDKNGEVIYDQNDNEVLDVSDESLSNLRDGNSDKYSETFVLPYDLDTSKVVVKAMVSACNDDYTGECFHSTITRNLTVDNAADKIEIAKATLTPSTLDCGVNKARLDVQVRNLGDRREELVLTLKNQNTGTETVLNNAESIELDNDYTGDSYTADYSDYLTLNGLKTGSNVFTLNVDYGLKTPTSKDIVVNLASCAPVQQQTPQQNTSNNPVVILPQNTQQNTPNVPTSNPTYVTLKDVSGSGFDLGADWVLPAVIGVGGLIVGIVVALLIVPRA